MTECGITAAFFPALKFCSVSAWHTTTTFLGHLTAASCLRWFCHTFAGCACAWLHCLPCPALLPALPGSAACPAVLGSCLLLVRVLLQLDICSWPNTHCSFWKLCTVYLSSLKRSSAFFEPRKLTFPCSLLGTLNTERRSKSELS